MWCTWGWQLRLSQASASLVAGTNIARGAAAAKLSVNDLDGEYSSTLQIEQSNSMKLELNLKSETNWQVSDTVMHMRVATRATAAARLVSSARHKNCTWSSSSSKILCEWLVGRRTLLSSRLLVSLVLDMWLWGEVVTPKIMQC